MKKTIITLIQFGIAGFLLWYVYSGEDPEKLMNTLKAADLSWVTLGFLAFGILVISGILRWWILLRAQDIHLTVKRTSGLFLIGYFFNQFIPGSTGGDIIKLYYVVKETHTKKSAAFLSVIVDRIMGLLGLMVIALVFILWRYDWLMGNETIRPDVLIFIGFLAAAVLGIVGAFIFANLGLVDKILPKWTPLREKFIEMAEAFVVYGKAWRHTLTALCLAIIGHLAIFFSFLLCARSVTKELDATDLFSVMPMINTAASLPIAPGGVGVRDALFVRYLGELCATPSEIAGAIAIITYAIMVAWGLIGGVIYPFYRSGTPSHLSETDVDKVEDEDELIDHGEDGSQAEKV